MNEKPKSAMERAREYGIDISLLESNLRKTPTERVRALMAMMEFFDEAQRRLRDQYGDWIIHDNIARYSGNLKEK